MVLLFPIKTLFICYGAEAVTTERIYLRSLQDVTRSIVRVEVIYLRVADISCMRDIRESMGLSYGGPYSGVLFIS